MIKRDIIINNNILFEEKKIANDDFFILTLFAIAYELSETNGLLPGMTTEIDLAVGLPPGHFGGKPRLHRLLHAHLGSEGVYG